MEYSYKIGGYSCINLYSFMWYFSVQLIRHSGNANWIRNVITFRNKNIPKTELNYLGVINFILRTSDVFTLVIIFMFINTGNLRIIQGEHKNTSWFQVVIKLKLHGIFLQNWWLQLHKLIQFHVVFLSTTNPSFWECQLNSQCNYIPK